jgi:hypothetical protein
MSRGAARRTTGDEMNSGASPVQVGAATLATREQAIDPSHNDAERKRVEKVTLAPLPQRFLYWIYERRLLRQVERRPMPRHIGIILPWPFATPGNISAWR